jgi:hypothetical protein
MGLKVNSKSNLCRLGLLNRLVGEQDVRLLLDRLVPKFFLVLVQPNTSAED